MVRIHHLKPGYHVLNPAKARIIAHLIADGCAYASGTDYILKYSSNDEQSLREFTQDVATVYGLQVTRMTTRSGKTGKQLPFVRFRSKRAFEDLCTNTRYHSRSWSVPKAVASAGAEVRVAFLRAFFDDEGTVYLHKGVAVVRGYSVNLSGLKQIGAMLDALGVETKIHKGFGMKRHVYGLMILDPTVFADHIGFGLKRKQERLQECLRRGTP